MIGGIAWLLYKNKKTKQEQAEVLSPAPMREYPLGYVQSLAGFLSQYHPGIRIFQAYGSNQFEVLLPEDPNRQKAEKACDDAFERFKP